MFLQKIRNFILPLFFLSSLSPVAAQVATDDITAYASQVTDLVTTTLQQAAEKNTVSISDYQNLLQSNTARVATTVTKDPVTDLAAIVRDHLCEAPPLLRPYLVRVKDILFPPTTGPTYPANVVVAFRTLQTRIQGDRELDDNSRTQLMAYTEGLAKFVEALQALHDRYPAYFDQNSVLTTAKGDECKSWWCRWGKCAASVVGGALVGGLSGAVGGSTVPVIGTVAGGVIGTVGGGLAAAGQFCN